MSYHWELQADLRARLGDGGVHPSPAGARSIELRDMMICGERRKVTIRLVETTEKIDAACDLVNDRYSWRGYGAGHRIQADAYHMTFTAEIDEEVVGTITLAVDSAQGLAVDRTFADDIDQFRCAPGSKLCELTKFAFNSAVQSRELMAVLFHTVFVYGSRTHGCTDLLIEVNPRHVRFYETMLGFKRIGSIAANESVAAPAQLMALKVATIRENIDAAAASNADRASARSLYPFFLSPTEENGIYRRLARRPELVAERSRERSRHPRRDVAALFDSFRRSNHAAFFKRLALREYQFASQ